MWGGISRTELAKRLGVSGACIILWEKAGLLAPDAAGRPGVSVHYGSAAQIRAKAIRALTTQGVLLSEIREALGPVESPR